MTDPITHDVPSGIHGHSGLADIAGHAVVQCTAGLIKPRGE
jgi:hypothetical protein